MVFNTTSNNISVISWRSVLLVGETEVPGENHQLVPYKLDHIMLYRENHQPVHDKLDHIMLYRENHQPVPDKLDHIMLYRENHQLVPDKLDHIMLYRENHQPVPDKLDHIMLYTPPWSRFEPITSLVIGTDCNYHTITTTTAPLFTLQLKQYSHYMWRIT